MKFAPGGFNRGCPRISEFAAKGTKTAKENPFAHRMGEAGRRPDEGNARGVTSDE